MDAHKETFEAIGLQLDNAYGYFPEPKKIKLEKAEQNHLLHKRPSNPNTAPAKNGKSKKVPRKVKGHN